MGQCTQRDPRLRPPARPADWQAGEVRQFFVYHQLATGTLYQIKCGAVAGSMGLPQVDCVQVGHGAPAALRALASSAWAAFLGGQICTVCPI